MTNAIEIVNSWAPSPEQKTAEVGLMTAAFELFESLHPEKLEPYPGAFLCDVGGDVPHLSINGGLFPLESNLGYDLETFTINRDNNYPLIEWEKWTRIWKIWAPHSWGECRLLTVFPAGYSGPAPAVLVNAVLGVKS